MEPLAAHQPLVHMSVTKAAVEQAACVMLRGSVAPTHSISLQEGVPETTFQLAKRNFQLKDLQNRSASGLLAFFSASAQIINYLSDSFSPKDVIAHVMSTGTVPFFSATSFYLSQYII